jgi:serine/threonine protein kinase
MGCILFKMMTGKTPFEVKDGKDKNEGILENIRNRSFSAPLPTTFTQELRDLVDKIFTKE